MATFYTINFGSNGIPRLGRSLSYDMARELVECGEDVWTRQLCDARDLAVCFETYEHDDIHFDIRNHLGVRFTLEHFHVGDRKIRRRPHICYGHAVNDHDSNDILILE